MDHKPSTESNDIFLFSEYAVEQNGSIAIYGQYDPHKLDRSFANHLELLQEEKPIACKIKCFKKRNDFRISIKKAALSFTEPITARLKTTENTTSIKPLQLSHLVKPNTVTIVTMVKNYAHRIVEWIDYHITLGFSHIVIFDNGSTDGLEEVLNKYSRDQITLIPFPYTPFPNRCFADTQRIAHNIGVNALKKRCAWVCLLDADEFVYLPKMKPMNIERFLSHPLYRYFKAICMPSILLTNKAVDETFNNNLLDRCRYTDNKPKYTKLFLNQRSPSSIPFLKNPHRIRGQLKLGRRKIYHGHIWANKRMQYDTQMIEIHDFIETKKIN